MGRVERTDFISTVRPARLSQKAPQWSSLFFILSRIWFQAELGRDLRQIGIPRYLKVFHFSMRGKRKMFSIR
jgi:hypothetical protein